jgi:two-component system sensor histidine kinase PilS (NtrC family)
MIDLIKDDAPTKNLAQKVRWLILGRVLTFSFLFVTSWLWHNGQIQPSFENLPRGVFLVFVVSILLSLLYSIFVSFTSYLAWQVRFQFLADAALITWLVWASGDVLSPYVTLYTVLICVTSIFLGPNGTLLAATGCAFAFTVLSSLTAFGLIPRISGSTLSLTFQQIVQVVGFNDVSFLAVGLLAGQLAARNSRSSVQLQEATQNLAQLQRLHERIVQSIRSGLITTDLEGKIYIFNATAEDITGLKSEEMQGKSIYTLFGNIEQPIAVSLDAAENDESPPRFEIDFITHEGFGVRLGYSISPLFSENGQTTGLIVTFQDLTEMRSMEETSRRRDRLAAVGRVAAGLAHEIRNPLGAMRGAIQVLQTSVKDNPSQSQLMEIVMRESDRLNSIITNFLDYARPRQNDFERTDIREIIRDSITLMRHSPDIQENHRLVEELPQKSVFTNADAAQLKQVFWNLARNAIQAMPEGGILTIKLLRLPTGRLQITFTDTGCGMPPAQVERLFEPFSNSTTGGTGLGLSIVYQIVRDHNGIINIRSLEGKGTTITIELPSEGKGIGLKR